MSASSRARCWCGVLLATSLMLVSLLVLTANGAVAAGPKAQGCTIVGTAGDDILAGTPQADVICGRGGDDSLYGHGGGDALIGGAGQDALFGGPGNDLLIGVRGSDVLRGGSGRDLVRRQPLKNDRDYNVDLETTYNVPYGTRITWKILYGVCTRETYQSSFIYDQSTPALIGIFIVIGGGLASECGYLRSYVRYNVRFEQPDGVTKDVNVNVKQSVLPNIYMRGFEVICEGQSVRCEGTADSRLAEYGGPPTPTVTFGPIPPEPTPEPVPTEPPTLNCKDEITVKANTPVKDLPICTSTGKPLPTLTFNGVVPPGVDGSRLSPTSSTVVLNGSFPTAKKYGLLVRGTVPNPAWQEEELVSITVTP